MSAFIQFKDVKKTYKVGDIEIHASNGVNFEVNKGDNRGSVYLYCLEDSWKAFGYSAFYLSLLYPGMKIVKYDNPDIICFFVCISDDCLMEIFEMSRIYVGNECIEMKVPERICGGENEYVKWCNELCLNL